MVLHAKIWFYTMVLHDKIWVIKVVLHLVLHAKLMQRTNTENRLLRVVIYDDLLCSDFGQNRRVSAFEQSCYQSLNINEKGLWKIFVLQIRLTLKIFFDLVKFKVWLIDILL